MAPFAKRYWRRFALGLVLSILFGLTHGAILWGIQTVFHRVEQGTSSEAASAIKAVGGFGVSLPIELIRSEVEVALDAWLPLRGRPLDARQVIGGIGFLAFFALLRGVLGYFGTYCFTWASERVINDLKSDALVKLNTLSLDYFNRSRLGDLLTRITQDTAMVQRMLSLGIGDLIKEPVTIVTILVMLFLADWKLTLLAMFFLPLCALPIAILGRKVRKHSKQGWEIGILQSSVLIETLSNIRVTKAFGLERLQEEEFRDYARRGLSHSFRTLRAKEMTNPIVETISMISVGCVILYVVHTNRTVADLLSFLAGLVFLSNPIKKMAGIGLMVQQTRVALERLRDFYMEEPSVKNRPNAKPMRPFQEGIEFRKVGFRYSPETEWVLRDVNFRLARGEWMGLAGESGSGKSTLVNLLFRFYEVTEGEILVDGVDIREMDLASLRASMALVSQETMLFNRPVAENIAFGKLGAGRAEVEQAARLAHAIDFIRALPNGFDTDIGERGVRLSGGQRQRITIARAFVRNAPILALDEATASLDSESEAEVQAALEMLSRNRTVLCVAHRLSTLSNMSQILVFSKGIVVERGSFRELLSAKGSFSEMARRQGILSA